MYDLQHALRETKVVLRRFPVVMVAVLIVTASLQLLIGMEDRGEGWGVLLRIVVAGGVALPLFIGLKLFAESRLLSLQKQVILYLAGLLLVVLYYSSLETGFDDLFPYQFFPTFMAAHLLVSVSPFSGQSDVEGFWLYNIRLLTRFLSSLLHACILNSGLALAMLAVEKLFDVGIPESVYLRISVIVFMLFMTLFFLSGVPRLNEDTPRQVVYPRALRIISQYILGILVLVYMIILYAFSAKVLILQQWPNGWLSMLILGFSSIALFNYCLLWPIRQETGNAFAIIYSRWIFIILIPLVLLLWKAIMMRITQYGLTINRYLVAELAVWLSLSLLFFNMNKKKDLRFIPVSLIFSLVAFAFGPLSGKERSLSSQSNQLRELSVRYGMYDGDGILPLQEGRAMPGQDEARFYNIINYIIRHGGEDRLHLIFRDDPSVLLTGLPVHEKAARLVKELNLTYRPFYDAAADHAREFAYYRDSKQPVLDIGGYSELVQYSYFRYNMAPYGSFTLRTGQELKVDIDTVSRSMILKAGQDDEVLVDLTGLVYRLCKDYRYESNSVSPDILRMDVQSSRTRYRILFSGISGKMGGDSKVEEISAISAEILIDAGETP